MQLAGQEQFDVPRQVLWDHLTDLTLLSKTIPGLVAVEHAEAKQLVCKVRPGLSFLSGTLKLHFDIVEEQPPERAIMEIKGKGIGASVAVRTQFQLAENGDGSQLDWTGEILQLGGLLKPIGKSLIEAAAQKIIADGWTRFRQSLDQG